MLERMKNHSKLIIGKIADSYRGYFDTLWEIAKVK
jgi:hypothetical protein